MIGFSCENSSASQSVCTERRLTDNIPCHICVLHRSKIVHGLLGLCRHHACTKDQSIGQVNYRQITIYHTWLDFAESHGWVGFGMQTLRFLLAVGLKERALVILSCTLVRPKAESSSSSPVFGRRWLRVLRGLVARLLITGILLSRWRGKRVVALYRSHLVCVKGIFLAVYVLGAGALVARLWVSEGALWGADGVRIRRLC